MSGSLGFNPLGQSSPVPGVPTTSRKSDAASGRNFAEDLAQALRDQLSEVNSLQTEVDTRAQAVALGQTESVTDLFSAARKAEVAFTMLMEIRNKLVEAYDELQNLRV
jgi:flagellar hook-basal body complex protein FliE